jgi:hypothetical protein
MTAEIVTAVSVAVTCTTAFLVGYWHRKQLRQLELYRKDPSVGMVPPPSFLTVFFKKNFDLLCGILLPTLSAWLLVSGGKGTALTSLLISLNIGSMLLTLVGRAFSRLSKEMIAVSRDFLEIHKAQRQLSLSQVEGLQEYGRLLVSNVEILEKLGDRVEALEERLAQSTPR